MLENKGLIEKDNRIGKEGVVSPILTNGTIC